MAKFGEIVRKEQGVERDSKETLELLRSLNFDILRGQSNLFDCEAIRTYEEVGKEFDPYVDSLSKYKDNKEKNKNYSEKISDRIKPYTEKVEKVNMENIESTNNKVDEKDVKKYTKLLEEQERIRDDLLELENIKYEMKKTHEDAVQSYGSLNNYMTKKNKD